MISIGLTHSPFTIDSIIEYSTTNAEPLFHSLVNSILQCYVDLSSQLYGLSALEKEEDIADIQWTLREEECET